MAHCVWISIFMVSRFMSSQAKTHNHFWALLILRIEQVFLHSHVRIVDDTYHIPTHPELCLGTPVPRQYLTSAPKRSWVCLAAHESTKPNICTRQQPWSTFPYVKIGMLSVLISWLESFFFPQIYFLSLTLHWNLDMDIGASIKMGGAYNAEKSHF